nr:TadE/TadG family type IV pilus assembly protein [Roseibium hamelinense]
MHYASRVDRIHVVKTVFRNFRRNQSGVTAIEFAFLAPLYFTLLLSSFELGLLYSRIAMLDHAVSTISKSVYIGTVAAGVDAGTITSDDIEQDVCDIAGLILPNCVNNITVELTEIASLTSFPAADATCRDSGTGLDPVVEFDPGGSSSIMFMRVCVTTNIITPGLGLGLSLPKTDTDRYELISSMAFMNEPF